MSRSTIHVGLEIGTSKVCAVVGEIRTDGSVKILGYGTMPSRGVRKGEITDESNANRCVGDAIRLAEDRADVTIESVYLAVSGGHISGRNHRGCVHIPEDQKEITMDDVEEIKIIARNVEIPKANAFLHTIIRRYYVDGQEGVGDPVGMCGSQLEADYHIVHGIKTRLQNAIRFVREIPLDVDDIVFSPIAAAQVLLSREDKERGALVIDIGGGTTDYVLYDRGSICQSGSIAVGGDHINNDIAMVMKARIGLAERLKTEHGSAVVEPDAGRHAVVLEGESHLAGRKLELEELQTITAMRMAEILECVRKPLADSGYLERVGSGIFLTGGSSQIRNMPVAVEQIFPGIPVMPLSTAPVNGPVSVIANPEFTTAIGLVRYAQLQDQERPSSSVFRKFGSMVGGLFGIPRAFNW